MPHAEATPAWSDVTLRTAVRAAGFCSGASAIYAIAGAEASPVVELFLSAAPLIAVILWLQKDASRTGVGELQDWGFFLWLAWPVLIPVRPQNARRCWLANWTRTVRPYPVVIRVRHRSPLDALCHPLRDLVRSLGRLRVARSRQPADRFQPSLRSQ